MVYGGIVGAEERPADEEEQEDALGGEYHNPLPGQELPELREVTPRVPGRQPSHRRQKGYQREANAGQDVGLAQNPGGVPDQEYAQGFAEAVALISEPGK